MSIKAVSAASPTWFKPESQAEDPNPAEFKLRPLTQPEYFEVINDGYDPERRRFTARGIMTAVRYGLIDWKNYLNAEGKEQKFTRGALNDMPYDVLNEIGVKVVSLTQMTEDERKN
jgi:hypothetical protein